MDIYPFHYATMVVDANDTAAVWMSGNYNIRWVPSNYFDGGQRVIIGSNTQVDFRDTIEYVGSRDVTPLYLEVSVGWLGAARISIHVALAQVQPANQAPLVPSTPSGSELASTSAEYEFTAMTDDPDGDSVYYMWHFGDDSTGWLGPYDSGIDVPIMHSWDSAGTYDVKVRAKDVQDNESDWSSPLAVQVKLCGDAATSGVVDIDDAVMIVMYVLASGEEPEPYLVADVDCSLIVDIDDAVDIIAYIFSGGPPPCDACE